MSTGNLVSIAPSTESRQVGTFIFDGANILDCSGPAQVFETASRLLHVASPEKPHAYQNTFISSGTEPIRTSCGMRVVPDATYRGIRRKLDTLVIAGGDVSRVIRDHAFLAWVRQQRTKARRTASVCTGAFVLAEAGLLNGRRATTHWNFADQLRDQYPDVEVDADALFVAQDDIYTSAGVTAGMDLALALVEEDHGRPLALQVARQLVLFLKRPGGQSQFSAHLSAQSMTEGKLQALSEWIVDHLDHELDVEALAQRAAMSPRNFARVFLEETGTTPAKFVEKARVDRARRDLEDSNLSLDEIATASGFGNSERMRRTFQRHLNVVPQDYRQRFERSRDRIAS
ncbi:MAG: transcriptional regulator GlxA family with amidase domain [Hyphomicrobiaceae bacterium]|jgi:transcriptional regulator GlxA family with amidase domain